jgi:4-hydroxy-3-methylbut-2-enyl diphosphate reductase
MGEAKKLARYITGERPADEFYAEFRGQYSPGFDVIKDLQRIGVVNQTTMLASDTQSIADYLKQVMLDTYKPAEAEERFADTRDTLCYATNDNQTAVLNMLETSADLALVIGGYNSSNTSHLVELCEEKLPTYFINSQSKILSSSELMHYNLHTKEEIRTTGWLPAKEPVRILITSGASCPDALVEGVIERLISFFKTGRKITQLIHDFT